MKRALKVASLILTAAVSASAQDAGRVCQNSSQAPQCVSDRQPPKLPTLAAPKLTYAVEQQTQGLQMTSAAPKQIHFQALKENSLATPGTSLPRTAEQAEWNGKMNQYFA